MWFLWIALSAWAQLPEEPGTAAMEMASQLIEEVGPRGAGTPGAVEAQKWVFQQLETMGWEPMYVGEHSPDRTVIACREGAKPDTVLFLAHTDTVHPLVDGANDNAAAVGVLLVLAKSLEGETHRTVCLGFPDGEEIGLRGSRVLASLWNESALSNYPLNQVMALDLVGRGTLTHNGLSSHWSGASIRALLRMSPAAVPFVYRGLSHGWPHMERSDHRPFTGQGIRASHLMARAESGFYPAYHSVADQLDVLQEDTLADAVRGVWGVAHGEVLPEKRGGLAIVIPYLGVVLDSWMVWVLGLVCSVLGLCVWRGTPLSKPAILRGVGVWLSGGLVASLLAGLVMSLGVWGRDWHWFLTPWILGAGWGTWGAVAALWPGLVPGRLGRISGWLIAGVMILGAVWVGLPLLAVPPLCAWAALGGLALMGDKGDWTGFERVVQVACIVSLFWIPGYVLAPDTIRELAFHGLIVADIWTVTVGFFLFTAPLWGGIQGRVFGKGKSRLWFAGACMALAITCVVVALNAPVEKPPMTQHHQYLP